LPYDETKTGRRPGVNDPISSAASHVSAWIVPTDEERMISLYTSTLIATVSPD
jgi:acetate kinase